MYHKWLSCDVWFLRYGAWQAELFCHFKAIFCPNPENQNFEKMKKILGNIIILHMCTINENHMMYDSWDMERHKQNLFSFWTIFCPFTPLTPRKSKFCKNTKTPLDIIILHKCTIHENHMMHGSWDTKHGKHNFLLWLGHFLPFYPTKIAKNQNFGKMNKTPIVIIILHKCTKKHDNML